MQIYFGFYILTTFLQVLMKDITTPVPVEEMRKIVQKCLEKAALINYSQLTDYAHFEGLFNYLITAIHTNNNFPIILMQT